MDDDEIKKLPDGWKWIKLGGKTGIADIVNGSTPSTDAPEYWGGDILWTTPSDLGNSHSIYIENTERKITKAGLESCSTTLLPIETVLLTSRAPVGNLAIAKKPICTNQGFKSFIPRDGINSLYLYFAIKKIVPKIQKASHGNTFTEITKELVQDFKIPLPPTIDDQIRIASELERKMAEVETMRQAALRQKEAAAVMQGAILQEVFQYKEGDKLPEGWEWVELDSLFTIDKQQIDKSNTLFNSLYFIGLENIESDTRKYVPSEENEENGSSTCFLFSTKHVLYGKLRPYLNKVYLPNGDGRCSMELLPLLPKNGYSRDFIAAVVQSEIVIAFAVKHSTGGRMPRANINKINKLKVPRPSSNDECNYIGNYLNIKFAQLDKMRQAAKQQLEAIEALPGAILREVFDFEEDN
jgi:type I restriction enzyme S subunit